MFPWLPDLEILGEIGRGSFYVIYQARDLRLNCTVALKSYRLDTRLPEQAQQFLMREAEILATVRHPHIVRFFMAFEYEGRLFLQMEYLEGGLRKRQKDGPIPAGEAA
jgi:serine/threonine protein kinase